jgi:hypothetical protein
VASDEETHQLIANNTGIPLRSPAFLLGDLGFALDNQIKSTFDGIVVISGDRELVPGLLQPFPNQFVFMSGCFTKFRVEFDRKLMRKPGEQRPKRDLALSRLMSARILLSGSQR